MASGDRRVRFSRAASGCRRRRSSSRWRRVRVTPAPPPPPSTRRAPTPRWPRRLRRPRRPAWYWSRSRPRSGSTSFTTTAPRAPTTCRRSWPAACAIFDYDGDDDLDLYLDAGGRAGAARPVRRADESLPIASFARRRTAPSRDVTASAGVGDRGYGMGCRRGRHRQRRRPRPLREQLGSGHALPQRRRRHLLRHHRGFGLGDGPAGRRRPCSSTSISTASSICT